MYDYLAVYVPLLRAWERTGRRKALFRMPMQLPTSSTSRRDGYSCGFDLCLRSKGHLRWMASKPLSAEGHLLQGSWQGIDPTRKDVGNCKMVNTAMPCLPANCSGRAALAGLGAVSTVRRS